MTVTDEAVETACKAFADATGYYVPFHRGLSSESSDKLRRGMRAALEAVGGDEGTRMVPICLACGKPAIGNCTSTSVHHRIA